MEDDRNSHCTIQYRIYGQKGGKENLVLTSCKGSDFVKAGAIWFVEVVSGKGGFPELHLVAMSFFREPAALDEILVDIENHGCSRPTVIAARLRNRPYVTMNVRQV